MKRLTALIILIIMLVSVLVTACGGNNGGETADQPDVSLDASTESSDISTESDDPAPEISDISEDNSDQSHSPEIIPGTISGVAVITKTIDSTGTEYTKVYPDGLTVNLTIWYQDEQMTLSHITLTKEHEYEYSYCEQYDVNGNISEYYGTIWDIKNNIDVIVSVSYTYKYPTIRTQKRIDDKILQNEIIVADDKNFIITLTDENGTRHKKYFIDGKLFNYECNYTDESGAKYYEYYDADMELYFRQFVKPGEPGKPGEFWADYYQADGRILRKTSESENSIAWDVLWEYTEDNTTLKRITDFTLESNLSGYSIEYLEPADGVTEETARKAVVDYYNSLVRNKQPEIAWWDVMEEATIFPEIKEYVSPTIEFLKLFDTDEKTQNMHAVTELENFDTVISTSYDDGLCIKRSTQLFEGGTAVALTDTDIFVGADNYLNFSTECDENGTVTAASVRKNSSGGKTKTKVSFNAHEDFEFPVFNAYAKGMRVGYGFINESSFGVEYIVNNTDYHTRIIYLDDQRRYFEETGYRNGEWYNENYDGEGNILTKSSAKGTEIFADDGTIYLETDGDLEGDLLYVYSVDDPTPVFVAKITYEPHINSIIGVVEAAEGLTMEEARAIANKYKKYRREKIKYAYFLWYRYLDEDFDPSKF